MRPADQQKPLATRLPLTSYPLVNSLSLSADDTIALADEFQHGPKQEADVLSILANRAFGGGNVALAERLASIALQHAPKNSWSSTFGGTRLNAYATMIAVGGPDRQRAACVDLADQIGANTWLASSLTYDLFNVVNALD